MCVLGVTVVVAAGCGSGGGRARVTARRFPCVVGVNVKAGEAPDLKALARQCRALRPAPGTPLPSAGTRPAAVQGRAVATQSACAACHQFGSAGNPGPGPPLTRIAQRLPAAAIRRALVEPDAPMPSFVSLGPHKLDALVAYLEALGGR